MSTQLTPEELDAINSASLNELEILRGDIVDNITSIDAQLASNGHKPDGSFLMPANEYYNWRTRAVRAKAIKTIQLRAVNRRLKALRAEQHQAGRNEFYKERAENLRDALYRVQHHAKNVREAKEWAEAALEEFDMALSQEK